MEARRRAEVLCLGGGGGWGTERKRVGISAHPFPTHSWFLVFFFPLFFSMSVEHGSWLHP